MKSFLLAASLLFLWSCSKQKEQLEKIVCDSRQINSQEKHSYTFYPSGKIKTKSSTTYWYSNGSLIDSMLTEKTLFYNNKGRIIKLIEGKTNEYYYYNTLDSLVGKYSINEFGDTTQLDETIYKNGKVSIRKDRSLRIKFNEDDITKTDFRNYDTTFNQTLYSYSGDSLEIQVFKDLKDESTGERHVFYRNGQISKASIYNFLGSLKYLQNITHYDYNSNIDASDNVVINTSGDTTGMRKTFLKDTIRIVWYYLAESNIQDYSYYNSQNQLIQWVVNDLSSQTKRTFDYLYDLKGNLIEETQFTERIPKNPE